MPTQTTRPTVVPTWTDGSAPFQTQPGSGQLTTGWVSNEKPPYQYMNWILWILSIWIQYIDNITNPTTIQSTQTGNFTAAFPVRTYLVSPSGSNANATFPTAASIPAQRFTIKNIALGGVKTATVLPAGGDTLEQQASLVLNPGDVMTFESDGVNTWWQV